MTTTYTPVATKHATVELPTDADTPPSAALVSSPLEGALDNAAEARARTGLLRVLLVTGGYVDTQTLQGTGQTNDWSDGHSQLPVSSISGVSAADTDVLVVSVDLHVASDAAMAGAFRLAAKVGSGALQAIPGSERDVQLVTTTGGDSYTAIHLQGRAYAASLGAGAYTFWLQQKNFEPGSPATTHKTFTYGPLECTVTHYRSNGA
jgi:hypothetical protein